MSKKNRHKGLVWLLLVLCLAALAFACWRHVMAGDLQEESEFYRHVVGSVQDEAAVEVMYARGILECAETKPAMAGIRGRLTELMPLGTTVKKGEVLFRQDDTMARETIETNTTNLANTELNLVRLDAQYQLTDFQESQKILLSEARLKHAQLEEQEELKVPDERARRLMAIEEELAQLDVDDSEDEYARELRMFRKGYISASALESVAQRLANARAALQELKLKNVLTKKGATEERRVELRMAVARAEALKVRAEARKARRVGEIKANQKSEKREEERIRFLIDYHTDELEKAAMKAPMDGVFVVSTYRDWTTGGTLKEIAVGDEKYKNDIIGQVINPKKMEVRLAVHESDFHRLHAGMDVDVELPAVLDRRFHGTIERIGAIGRDRNHVDPTGILGGNSEISMFNVVVKLDTEGEVFHPGMSALVSIQLKKHDHELLIPRAALYPKESGDGLQVRMAGGEPREVTGRYFNAMYFAVETGLQRGDEIEISKYRGKE